jgi:hypothetical protein
MVHTRSYLFCMPADTAAPCAFATCCKMLNTINRASSASFCQGLGTSSDSLFKFSVQIFTTPSLVQAVDQDLLTAASTSTSSSSSSSTTSTTAGVHALLVQCLVDCFAVAGASIDSTANSSSTSAEDSTAAAADRDAFLDHTVTTFRRFAHIFGDLEYALASPGAPPPDATTAGTAHLSLCLFVQFISATVVLASQVPFSVLLCMIMCSEHQYTVSSVR